MFCAPLNRCCRSTGNRIIQDKTHLGYVSSQSKVLRTKSPIITVHSLLIHWDCIVEAGIPLNICGILYTASDTPIIPRRLNRASLQMVRVCSTTAQQIYWWKISSLFIIIPLLAVHTWARTLRVSQWSWMATTTSPVTIQSCGSTEEVSTMGTRLIPSRYGDRKNIQT